LLQPRVRCRDRGGDRPAHSHPSCLIPAFGGADPG
jgi:hypothetical protein